MDAAACIFLSTMMLYLICTLIYVATMWADSISNFAACTVFPTATYIPFFIIAYVTWFVYIIQKNQQDTNISLF
jgi:hypothetical protein